MVTNTVAMVVTPPIDTVTTVTTPVDIGSHISRAVISSPHHHPSLITPLDTTFSFTVCLTVDCQTWSLALKLPHSRGCVTMSSHPDSVVTPVDPDPVVSLYQCSLAKLGVRHCPPTPQGLCDSVITPMDPGPDLFRVTDQTWSLAFLSPHTLGPV